MVTSKIRPMPIPPAAILTAANARAPTKFPRACRASSSNRVRRRVERTSAEDVGNDEQVNSLWYRFLGGQCLSMGDYASGDGTQGRHSRGGGPFMLPPL